ncbi:uncharacterized protein LOC118461311 [Anopheles albimanus]|uniref:uncharacterized protein LOC118461311 n=1 Tax=Anopheles albimanus TaxID=7167 RepID=UPI001641B583|nr:uncharacterized protein LOC118461311 [Anopheles albimanus]
MLLTAFEQVIEKLTTNPLQLDSVDYLRLLGDSLEKFSSIVQRLSANVPISDWLLRYQLQLLKIFDTIEFCLSEEQFIVIGSKEKYCKTSTQESIHAAKQLITHYKIASEQGATGKDRVSEQSHIQLLATRQGLIDAPSSEPEKSRRAAPESRHQRAANFRRHATRSPVVR